MGFDEQGANRDQPATALVVDNSIVMRWLVDSGKPADRKYALSVRDYIHQEDCSVLVPYLWIYEAANVAASYVREGLLESGAAKQALQALHDLLTIRIDRAETPSALFDAASSYRLTAYDAGYLLLAKNESRVLATLDKDMKKAARKVGVVLWEAP
ncbi:MAG: type II toxin-antitoxin system VapC family toxin [Pseudomonadota bacterium]